MATQEERQEIAEFLALYWGMEEEVEDIRDTMNVAVVRDYISDGPGYWGPIYFVVFGGGPEFHVVLIKWEGNLERIESEFPMKENIVPERHDPGCTGKNCDCL